MLLLTVLSGCSVTVSKPVASTSHADEASYRQVWSQDWTAVIQASTPWNPVGTSPGACDKGGDINACYGTDQAVLPLLHTLATDLSSASIPPQYSKANTAMVSALNAEGQGLLDRDAGIRNNDNAVFSKAFDELHVARTQLVAAYRAFPSGDQPVPAMFGPGRHSS
jgi:hypothetical protein